MSISPDSVDEHHDESVAKVAKLIAETKVCMLTTTDAADYKVSRPMAVLEVEFDGDLWFVTHRNAHKIDQIRQDMRVNVAFASSHAWVSVAGEAEIVRDTAKAKELWGTGVSTWFPEGPDDPDIVLVKIRADSAEYWDTPGAITASVLSFVKTRLTGKPYSVENEAVRL